MEIDTSTNEYRERNRKVRSVRSHASTSLPTSPTSPTSLTHTSPTSPTSSPVSSLAKVGTPGTLFTSSEKPATTPSSRRKADALRDSARRWAVSAFISGVLLLAAYSIFVGLSSGGKNNNNDRQNSLTSIQAFAGFPSTTTVPTVTTIETSPTAVATSMATMVEATREAYASAIANNMVALRTSVALTHAPTDIPGTPLPEDSPTPMLGILPGCSNTNAYEPQAISCWRGVVDGQLVDVDAGREGRNGDTNQGIVRVHVWGQQNVDIYDTPSAVGAVSIESVSGTVFTLSTIGLATPQIFEFDLATRQWVSP